MAQPDIIDEGHGLELLSRGDALTVRDEDTRNDASLLFAFHEGALHDEDGVEQPLGFRQQQQVAEWFEEYEA